ncbi:transmembrane protein 127 [Ictalurus furcatus]|uniref:transmembrane protein 127 n=1 Tax=Ictalurus furcatus TaxID=66913 RepID=UPI002350A5E7|nr:transmembrane protein 127 [Ictalurus furcatus]
MPLTLSLSPAAVCQCFTLVSLCTAIADPNWIQVQNTTGTNQLIYGVAFTLHAAQNLSNTAPLGGMHGLGMDLLYTLVALCYSAVLLSSSSFLTDFLGIRFTRPRLVMSLHISTAMMCVAVLAVSGTCLWVVQQNVQKGRVNWVWSTASAPPSGLSTSPGESFYIEILALGFSFMAAVLSCHRPSESIVPSQFNSVEPEDGETERLIAGTGPDEDEWGD